MTSEQLQRVTDEPNALNSVAQFHRLFLHPVLESPTIPTKDRSELRIALIQEELDELKDAILANDIVAAADALCDLQYVLSGTVLEFGLKNVFASLFNEVHRSNMTKACKTEEEAKETVKYYQLKIGGEFHYELHDGLYLVYRTSDRKTLKSVNYEAANIFGILHRDETRLRNNTQ